MKNTAYKGLGALFAVVYAAHYAATERSWHFIDNVDLVIHEAGHTLFSFFGQFIYVLMGSSFQILFPALFAVYFFAKRDLYAGAIVLFWVGVNIINVSVYMGDAQLMVLPLIGGHHDWNWLFSYLNVLPYTQSIANVTYGLGIATMCAGALLSWFALIQKTAPETTH